jgi:hypothetical protein
MRRSHQSSGTISTGRSCWTSNCVRLGSTDRTAAVNTNYVGVGTVAGPGVFNKRGDVGIDINTKFMLDCTANGARHYLSLVLSMSWLALTLYNSNPTISNLNNKEIIVTEPSCSLHWPCWKTRQGVCARRCLWKGWNLSDTGLTVGNVKLKVSYYTCYLVIILCVQWMYANADAVIWQWRAHTAIFGLI